MKIVLTVTLVLLQLAANCQQHFKSGYIFRNTRLIGTNLFEKVPDPNSVDMEIGYGIAEDGSKIYLHSVTGTPTLKQRTIHNKLRGVIDRRDGDTLFLRFWDIQNTVVELASTDIDVPDNGSEFKYIIEHSKNSTWKNDHHFCVPYRHRMLTATYIPFKLDFKTGSTTADFLNFNLAYLWVFGRTKFFKNDDIDPRDFYFGIGPYIGSTTVDESASGIRMFGATYGGTMVFSVHKLNFVFSLGIDHGFTDETKRGSGYLGFGLGYSLMEIFEPSNK